MHRYDGTHNYLVSVDFFCLILHKCIQKNEIERGSLIRDALPRIKRTLVRAYEIACEKGTL